MATIVEIARRSRAYVAALDANIVRVIESNKEEMIDLNREQMIGHKDAEGKPLVNRLTGSELLSPAYAAEKGKTKPDLLDTGEFQDRMFFFMPNRKEFFISSKDREKTRDLSFFYGDIFGIAPENRPKAQKINDKDIIEDYLRTVLG